ncbi:MAG: lytic transglycosylase domain-containing protein [Planctomycetaceae bacterium]
MVCKSVKKWVGAALLLAALLQGAPLGKEPAQERAEVSARPAASRPWNPPGEEPFPVGLLRITERIAFEHGLSPGLVKSIILTESNGDPRKVSPKGAKGLMQLMPAVIQQYQVQDPYDPVTNIRAGVKYLVDLLEEFSGNLPLALAAYNAGPTAVRRYGGIPPFEETQAFVRRVSNLFHSLDPRSRIVHLAMNSGGGEPGASDSRMIAFNGSPRNFFRWLKTMGPESREAQIQ